MSQLNKISPDYFIPNRLENKVLLVTGAARGIGAAVVTRALKEGARVLAFDILAKQLEETTRPLVEQGLPILNYVGDVRSPQQLAEAAQIAFATYGSLDLACNAAGVMDATAPDSDFDLQRDRDLYPAAAATATDGYWHAVMEVNATGVFNSCRAELNFMLTQETGGNIVNIGSIAGLIGLPGNIAYSASKYAVEGITKSIALSYSNQAIRCNSVNMAATDTPMIARAMEFVRASQANSPNQSFSGQPGSKSLSILAAADPNHRPATTWEQAAVILFLLSDESSNITGATWPTDGGWTAY